MSPLKSLTPATAEKKRWKLWHFAVIVLLAALVFGAVRALGPGGLDRRPDDLIGNLFSLVVVLALAGVAPLALIRGGRKVAARTTSVLKGWGARRGGVVGFTAWFVAIGTEVGYYLVAILMGPVAAIALLLWLARLASR